MNPVSQTPLIKTLTPSPHKFHLPISNFPRNLNVLPWCIIRTTAHLFVFTTLLSSVKLNSPPAQIHAQYIAMLVSVFLALFLPCAGMSAVFVVYMCLLWYAATRDWTSQLAFPVKQVTEEGLSESDLEKLPKITGKELVLGTECAVCLDEIENDQPARLVPGCNHGFHLQCADTWLSKHSVCPICRAKLEPELFKGSENPC